MGPPYYMHHYLEHNLKGNPLKVRLIGDNGLLTYTYDLLGRQVCANSAYFRETIPSDGYDAAGNLRKVTLVDPLGELSTTYNYDSLYQLTEELDHKYSYDSINNRLSKDGTPYTLSPLNQVTDTGEDSYTYDLNGNLTASSDTTYTYDALNRLIALQNQEHFVSYTYDSSGRRMSRTIDGERELFFYQKNCEVGTFNGPVRILGKGREAEVKASIAIETPDGDIFAPIHDHRGNISLLLSLEGIPAETLHYTAFGETSISGPDITPWQFASKRFDPESGFIVFSNRYYIPTLSRWLTPDPLGFSDGPNLYAYVHNSPLLLFDPYGLFGLPFTNTYLPSLSSFQPIDPENLPKISYFDSFEDIFYRSEKSKIYNLGLPKIPNIMICDINGMGLSQTKATDYAKQLSRMNGNHDVTFIHNSTAGKIVDGIEALMGLNYIATPPVRLLHQAWDNFFKENPRGYIIQRCTSQGAIDTRNALYDYPKAKRDRMHIIAVALGAYIDEELCGSVVHYRADLSRDFVPYLFDPGGSYRCRRSIINLPSHTNTELFDHSVISETYSDPTRNRINKFITTYRGLQ